MFQTLQKLILKPRTLFFEFPTSLLQNSAPIVANLLSYSLSTPFSSHHFVFSSPSNNCTVLTPHPFSKILPIHRHLSSLSNAPQLLHLAAPVTLPNHTVRKLPPFATIMEPPQNKSESIDIPYFSFLSIFNSAFLVVFLITGLANSCQRILNHLKKLSNNISVPSGTSV